MTQAVNTPQLPPGIEMSLTAITAIERLADRFARITLQSPIFTGLRPPGPAAVFKLFIPPTAGDEPILPSFGAKYLPSWGDPAAQPTVRSYTVVDLAPESQQLSFIAYDPGEGSWWVDRFAPGHTLGFIGFKHALVPPAGCTDIIAVGDASAVGALTALRRHTAHRVHVTAPSDLDLIESVTATCDQPAVRLAATDEHGFPAVTWASLAEPAGVQAATTSLWLGGEVDSVRSLRSLALTAGVPPGAIVAHPYWSAGHDRDAFDRELAGRYRAAAAAGRDIQDPLVATEIELA